MSSFAPPVDLNAEGEISVAGLLLMANPVFQRRGECVLCLADFTCEGRLSAGDLTILLMVLFLGRRESVKGLPNLLASFNSKVGLKNLPS